jgi:ribosomal protein S18 acetylase RimI-like enzyme
MTTYYTPNRNIKFDYTCRKIDNVNDPAKNGFISLYQNIFADEPYKEDWPYNEVEKVWINFTKYSLYIAEISYCIDDENNYNYKVIGFASGCNSSYMDNDTFKFVESEQERLNFNNSNSFYVAELGVAKEYRKNGIAAKLMNLLHMDAVKENKKFAYLITACNNNNNTISFYTKNGYYISNIIYNCKILAGGVVDKKNVLVKNL